MSDQLASKASTDSWQHDIYS